MRVEDWERTIGEPVGNVWPVDPLSTQAARLMNGGESLLGD